MIENDYKPQHSLSGRIKLAYIWIPKNTKKLLDAGCAWGYGSYYFSKKVKIVHGIDPSKENVLLATQRYPKITFHHSKVENTTFQNNYFDAVVFCDTLEHVQNELSAINEIYRVLKPGGVLILSVPHKGLFSFLDPSYPLYFFKNSVPAIYAFIYRLKTGKNPPRLVDDDIEHRHYSLNDIQRLLARSKFNKHYTITNIFRSGLFASAIFGYINFVLVLLFGARIARTLMRPFHFLEDFDYWVPYGTFSYNIACLISKD